MKLVIKRTYHPSGTNGQLYINEALQCNTIELPWLNNKPQLSCIPEGEYEIKKRFSIKFGDHLILINVKDRSYILIHPANNAKKELRGCIAPVTTLTAPGQGSSSKKAFNALIQVVYPVLKNKKLFIKICSNN